MAQALRPEALLQCSMPQSPVYTLTHQGHKVEGYMVALSSKVTANWPIKLNTRSLDLIDPTLWKSSQGPCLFTWMVDRLNDWCGSWEVHSTSGANSQFIARTLTYHPLLLYDVFAGGNSWPTAVASIFHRFKTSLQVGIHHPPLLRQSSITLSCLCRWKFIALRHYADLPNLDHRVHFTMPFCMYEVGCHYVRLSCLLPPSHLIMFCRCEFPIFHYLKEATELMSPLSQSLSLVVSTDMLLNPQCLLLPHRTNALPPPVETACARELCNWVPGKSHTSY